MELKCSVFSNVRMSESVQGKLSNKRSFSLEKMLSTQGRSVYLGIEA